MQGQAFNAPAGCPWLAAVPIFLDDAFFDQYEVSSKLYFLKFYGDFVTLLTSPVTPNRKPFSHVCSLSLLF